MSAPLVPAECNARTEGGEMRMVLGGARGGGRRGDGGDGQRGLQEREGKSPFAEVAPSFWEFWGTMELGASGDRGEVEGEGVPLHQKQISYKRK